MKTIIAGSRSITSYSIVHWAIKESNIKISTIISGTASGVDKLGELYAKNNNINLLQFPADWKKYGKSAGYIRNKEMATEADALIAIWDGQSKGTNHMINIAKEFNLISFIKKIKPIDIFNKHELYDRSLTIYSLWNNFIANNPTLDYNIELKENSITIQQNLLNFIKLTENFRNTENLTSINIMNNIKIF
jgi:hypothetical protein